MGEPPRPVGGQGRSDEPATGRPDAPWPRFLAGRERFWTAALTDERYRENRVAVAERDGELVGIAMSGPPLDAGAAWARQLYVL